VPWRSPGNRRLKGESYKIEVYDNLVPQLLGRVSVAAKTMPLVVDGLAVQPSSTFAMARIERDREAALRKYKQDRDTAALERTMKRLDDEEREAQTATQAISAEEEAAWLQDLPALWAAADDSGRRLLTEALFEKVEVLGVKSVTIHPTPEADAHGWSEAFGSTPQLIPVEMVAHAKGTDGRGERTRASISDVQVIRFVEPDSSGSADELSA
jgi:hypothetical protein